MLTPDEFQERLKAAIETGLISEVRQVFNIVYKELKEIDQIVIDSIVVKE